MPGTVESGRNLAGLAAGFLAGYCPVSNFTDSKFSKQSGRQSGQFLAGFLAGFSPVPFRQKFFFCRLKAETFRSSSKHQLNIYTWKSNICQAKMAYQEIHLVHSHTIAIYTPNIGETKHIGFHPQGAIQNTCT